MDSTGDEYSIKSSEKNGLESVIIANSTGTTSVEILLFGGTLVSWVCEGVERIFVSPDALYNGNISILILLSLLGALLPFNSFLY